MTIIDYVVVSGVSTIKHYLTLGWQPYGNPFSLDGSVHQAMVLFDNVVPTTISHVSTTSKSKSVK